MESDERECTVCGRSVKGFKSISGKNTGKTISEDRLKERLVCSKRTLENYRKYQQLRADRYVPSDLVTPLYAGMTNNILLGTAEEEKYTTDASLKILRKHRQRKGNTFTGCIPFRLVGCSAPGALLQRESPDCGM